MYTYGRNYKLLQNFAMSSCLLEGKVDYNDDVGQLTCLIDMKICEICCYLCSWMNDDDCLGGIYLVEIYWVLKDDF